MYFIIFLIFDPSTTRYDQPNTISSQPGTSHAIDQTDYIECTWPGSIEPVLLDTRQAELYRQPNSSCLT